MDEQSREENEPRGRGDGHSKPNTMYSCIRIKTTQQQTKNVPLAEVRGKRWAEKAIN